MVCLLCHILVVLDAEDSGLPRASDALLRFFFLDEHVTIACLRAMEYQKIEAQEALYETRRASSI